MRYEAIDHVILPVSTLETAAPFERLGLQPTPARGETGAGTLNRIVYLGGASNLFCIEFLTLMNAEKFRANHWQPRLLQALEQPHGLFAVVLRVSDLGAALQELQSKGLPASIEESTAPDGNKICNVAFLPEHKQMIVNVGLVQYAQSQDVRQSRLASNGFLDHRLPLKRLDHLAIMAPDLEAATRFWSDTLGIPVSGEVRTPTMIIRQLRLGDAILELLGPATPDSPVAARPAGLASMIAVEVPDLPAAVDQARAAGFTLPDPAAGALPGTRTATISADQLSGMALQLLEYI
ncbi:MAG: VOC family protein [Dehalococcoidia bacterium]